MFGNASPEHRVGAVVHIGSSSVGVALVCSHRNGHSETLWQYREFAVLHENAAPHDEIKHIKTTLTNALLELGHSGLQALKASEHDATITQVQVSIAAPWAYSITKTITLKDEHPFKVTKEVITELIETAHKQSTLVFATNEIAKQLGLSITHGDVIGVTINGYPIHDPIGQEGREVSLSYFETAIAKAITETIDETIDKFFPNADIQLQSFMYVYFLTLRTMRPNTAEACLIDITGEATEIGILRDDILRHTTFIQIGMRSLVRNIATSLNVPKQEVLGYLKDPLPEVLERLTEADKKKVLGCVDEFEESLTHMFQRTGDALSIPETIFLRADIHSHAFFSSIVETAAAKATGRAHRVHLVTSQVLNVSEVEDTALTVAARFYAEQEQFLAALPEN